MNRKQIKAQAKAQIKGNIGILFLIALLIGVISCIPFVGAILAPGFTISVIMIYINMTYGKKPEVGDTFGGIKVLGKAWWLNIITAFFISMWSLLFYIPGIVKSFAYSMAPYILAENPNMTARQALNESKHITKGHKGELFVLGLSFIGWILLVCITFGIAAIWVVPYMSATYANAYNAIKAPAAASSNVASAADESYLNSMF